MLRAPEPPRLLSILFLGAALALPTRASTGAAGAMDAPPSYGELASSGDAFGGGEVARPEAGLFSRDTSEAFGAAGTGEPVARGGDGPYGDDLFQDDLFHGDTAIDAGGELVAFSSKAPSGSGSSPLPSVRHGEDRSVRWLQDWESKESSTDRFLTYWFNASPSGEVLDGAVRRIEAAAPGTTEGKLRSLMDEVHAAYEGCEGKVCRHHAMLTYEVSEELGYPVEFRTSGLTPEGHNWNQVTIDGRTFVVDAYNEIYYELE